MNELSFWFGLTLQMFVTVLLVWAPYVRRGAMLFGVRTGSAFTQSSAAASALRRYRLWVAIAGTAFLGFSGAQDVRSQLAATHATALAAILFYIRENRRLKPFAVLPEAVPVRTVELSTLPDRLPLVGWLSVLPLLWMIGVMFYIASQWDRIPDTYPVHWNIHGVANRWSEKSVIGVFAGPSFFVAIAAWLAAFGLTAWFGARRAEPMRRPVLVGMSLAVLALGVLQPIIALLPLTGAPAIGFVPVVVVFVLLTIAGPLHLIRESQSLKYNSSEFPTSDANWMAGLWYANREDPALFVAARTGIGLTPNMAKGWNWVLAFTPLILLAMLWWTLGSSVVKSPP